MLNSTGHLAASLPPLISPSLSSSAAAHQSLFDLNSTNASSSMTSPIQSEAMMILSLFSGAQSKIEAVKNLYLSGRLHNFKEVKALLSSSMRGYIETISP